MSDKPCCNCGYNGQEETSCFAREDKLHCECWYDGDSATEHPTLLHALTREQVVDNLVDKFLSWPLPDSVCSDLCATKQGYPHRSGTTLLAAHEAKKMFEHVLTELFEALAQQAQEVERLKLKEAELGELKLRLNCPMLAPSCLVCGHVKPFVIKHLEASAVGVCEDCRSASQQLAASQARVRELEGCLDLHRDEFLRIKALDVNDEVNGICDRGSANIKQNVPLIDQLATLQATLTAREARIRELEDWQNIVLGSGTDQETVIRMAANEYTKTAVQCWKDHTKKIEAERDAAVQETARLREALCSLL